MCAVSPVWDNTGERRTRERIARVMFVYSEHCCSGAHCRTCRDRDGGRSFRASLGTVFELPAGAPDFDCPHGRPWGYQGNAPVSVKIGLPGDPIVPEGERAPAAAGAPEGPARGLGDTIAAVFEATGIEAAAKAFERLTGRPCGCKDRRELLNRLVPYNSDEQKMET